MTAVATDLAYPWGFAVLDDGALLVNEIEGRMLLISADGETRTEVTGVPEVAASGQGGLLDLALAPTSETAASSISPSPSRERAEPRRRLPGPGSCARTAMRVWRMFRSSPGWRGRPVAGVTSAHGWFPRPMERFS